MFENLSNRLINIVHNLKGKGKIYDSDINATLHEIKLALLEADVSPNVISNFIERIKIRAKNTKLSKALNPGQQIIKIMYEELSFILGSKARNLNFNKNLSTIIMLVGLQGAGKTTFAGKIAKWLKNSGYKPLLIACDLHRPSAVNQLQEVGKNAGVEVFTPNMYISSNDFINDKCIEPISVAVAGLAKAKNEHFTVSVIDTAGRISTDESMMKQVLEMQIKLNPKEILLVLDSMTGQDSITTAQRFYNIIGITGIVLTKLDGDARGGAALSIRETTGLPILFTSIGERLEDFNIFHPDRMASRILGMGDIVTLVEQTEQVFGDSRTTKSLNNVENLSKLTLEDFLEQILAMRKIGPINNLLGMLPKDNNIKNALNKVDDKQLDRIQAIIRGMTPYERNYPKALNASRKLRIANGSGVTISEVNQLVDRFFNIKKTIKSISGHPSMLNNYKKLFNKANRQNKKWNSKKKKRK